MAAAVFSSVEDDASSTSRVVSPRLVSVVEKLGDRCETFSSGLAAAQRSVRRLINLRCRGVLPGQPPGELLANSRRPAGSARASTPRPTERSRLASILSFPRLSSSLPRPAQRRFPRPRWENCTHRPSR